MNVVYIIFAIILLILILDFKKGVILYAPLKLFFNINVRFGSFTFDFLMSLIILLLFIIDRKSYSEPKFPLKTAFVIYAIGYTATCLYPEFAPNFIPRIVLMVLAYSYIYYFCLDKFENIKFAITCYAVFAIVMCGNGLLTPLFGINPLDDYLQSISDKNNSMFIENYWVRMGQVRYRSFIPHAISYGVACCVIFYLLIWSLLQIRKHRLFLVSTAIVFLLSGIIICGSRTPILGLIPILYLLFAHKGITSKMKIALLFLGFIFLLFSGDYILYSINSLIDSKLAAEVGGSSTNTRLNQFAIAYKLLISQPFWGMGMNFDAYSYDSGILGAESVWFPLMMNNGLIGILSYAIIYFCIFRISFKSPGRSVLLVISTGWLIMRTATSLIGVTDVQFFTIYFCIYRYFELKKYKVLSKIINKDEGRTFALNYSARI